MSNFLYPVKEKKTDNHPDYTGKATIDGVEYELAAWNRTSKNDKPYLGLSIKKRELSPETEKQLQELKDSAAAALDDGVPF